jgi:hypothetical protein
MVTRRGAAATGGARSSRNRLPLVLLGFLVLMACVPIVLWELLPDHGVSLERELEHGLHRLAHSHFTNSWTIQDLLNHKSQKRNSETNGGGGGAGDTVNTKIDDRVDDDAFAGDRASLQSPSGDAGKKKKRDKDSRREGYKQIIKHQKIARTKPDEFQRPATLARGAAGLPMIGTPSLIEAERGHIECDADVDFLAYWNDPQGTYDDTFQSPFAVEGGQRKYVTFEPDSGGWNNIRMSMEIIVVFALTTGRTLVLPPDQPLYRLKADAKHVQRGIADFYPLDKWRRKLKIISTREFLEREWDTSDNKGGLFPLEDDEGLKSRLIKAADVCENRDASDRSCFEMKDYLRSIGHIPQFHATHHCLIFDREVLQHSLEVGNDADLDISTVASNMNADLKTRIHEFCGSRTAQYYSSEWHTPDLIHFASSDNKKYRLLNHVYSTLFFSEPAVTNYYKRFVRDFMHYKDSIFCAAGKIVKSLQNEAYSKFEDSAIDEEGGGGFSTIHARRGEFQYKKVKIAAEEWTANTKELWNPNGEVLYIATDEKDKAFFDPLKQEGKYVVKFLDDYWDMANLGDLDGNYMGMIDTIVASRGRVFVGTWFSTFSGYIDRMRGYSGMSINTMYYGTLDRKDAIHTWAEPNGNYYAREWPTGWVGIDGDDWISREYVPREKRIKTLPAPPRNRGGDGGDHGDHKSNGDNKKTPRALVGAERGHIECEVDVDNLVYWNDPPGTADVEFQNPFAATSTPTSTRYLTFTPDSGGWNNIRMSLEIVMVIAAATGRTLVLPPPQPLYLLKNDASKRERGFGDFFPLKTPAFAKRVKIISSKEFLLREGGLGGIATIPEAQRENVTRTATGCVQRKKNKNFCNHMFDYYKEVGQVWDIPGTSCLVFDEEAYAGGTVTSTKHLDHVEEFCGNKPVVYMNQTLNEQPLLHLGDHRLLKHYYAFLTFTNPKHDHLFKRFVRDYMRYHDSIWCAAGKIVHALQEEGQALGMYSRGYSSMHVRRGDLQYKQVKISAQEWYDHVHDIWIPNELIYVATDERNKTFFDPLVHQSNDPHTLRFLDDYWDVAKLGDMDPNHMGMIDTIVASQGRTFVGTYWSTFSGYINRLRGFYGFSMKDSYYGTLSHKTLTHTWTNDTGSGWQREYPDGWLGIDEDKWPSREYF